MRIIIAKSIDFLIWLRYYGIMEVVSMINRPLYVDRIMAYTDTPFVKVLTGVRRCGKSTVLKMIMEKLQKEHGIPSERIVSMRFDSMDYEDMTAKDMFKAVKEKLNPTGRTYLFLDEIQEIEGWEKVVNSLATDYDVDLYVTGSNSRMMSSEIATYLTGRYVSFRIYTLSFQEYLEFKKQYTQAKDIHAELADYIRWEASLQHICESIHRMRFIRLSGISIIPHNFGYRKRETRFARSTSWNGWFGTHLRM